jgi:hypothetical protein
MDKLEAEEPHEAGKWIAAVGGGSVLRNPSFHPGLA